MILGISLHQQPLCRIGVNSKMGVGVVCVGVGGLREGVVGEGDGVVLLSYLLAALAEKAPREGACTVVSGKLFQSLIVFGRKDSLR